MLSISRQKLTLTVQPLRLKVFSVLLLTEMHVFMKWQPILNYESYQMDCFDTAYEALYNFGGFKNKVWWFLEFCIWQRC